MEYIIYVDNKQVHKCDNWGEARKTFLDQNTDENTGLPIYVSIDGVPMWGLQLVSDFMDKYAFF